jgi:small ligand-binding sensory domain FIST
VTKIGVGYGNDQDAYGLGRSVARAALEASGITQADMLFAFCNGRLDIDRFYLGLRSVVGDATPIVGGSSIGVVTCAELSYEGFPAAAAAISSDSMQFAVSSAGELDRDEAATGVRLINGLQLGDLDRLLLIFYDSVRVPPGPNGPPVLNSSAPLLDGVEGKLAGHVPVFGAGLVGDYGFGVTRQFCGDRCDVQQAVGCLVSGDLTVYQTTMHGCIPLNGVYHTITRMQGNTVYELDGKPVVQIIDQLFGNSDWQKELPPISNLTIGVNHGERFGPPQEANYVNRLITGVIPDGSGIGMFESDLVPGQEIQFMIRDNRMMLESVRKNPPALLEKIRSEGKRPVFALYIDCSGRTAAYSATSEEEAAVVQSAMKGAGVPFLGFYSGVEIAPMLGRSRGLDWTGVLVILAEDCCDGR